MMNKKAMSAMVATILLIGFAAVLGLVVMSWGTDVIGEVPDTCSKVSLSISTEGNAIMVVPKINSLLCKDKQLDISEIVK
jgi:hypothetical protein